MFDVGWTEMLVIAIVMIVVVGPKDLPNMLRTFGRTTAKLRAMAADFQKQFNEALKEAELDDVKKSVDSLRGLNPASEIRKQLNPFEQAAADVRAGVDAAMKPKPAADPAAPPASTPMPAEPLKNGAVEMPGASPEAAPAFPAMTDASVVASAAPAVEPVAPRKAAARKTNGAGEAVRAKPTKAAAVAKAPVKAASTKATTTKVANAGVAKTGVAKAGVAKTGAKPATGASTKAPAKAKKTAGDK